MLLPPLPHSFPQSDPDGAEYDIRSPAELMRPGTLTPPRCCCAGAQQQGWGCCSGSYPLWSCFLFPSSAWDLWVTLRASFQLTTTLVLLTVFAWPICEFLEDRCSLICIMSYMIKPILKRASRCYYNTKKNTTPKNNFSDSSKGGELIWYSYWVLWGIAYKASTALTYLYQE